MFPEVACKDTCSMVMQEQEYTNLLEGKGKSIERGPNEAGRVGKPTKNKCAGQSNI